ncbi:MAG: LPS export ABC transporter periplasmic protein LptC [Gemmatimonadetes bacterium]|nr:MAG: LPS export ABC transporter periplasmic protein LptC [Gemmatimonadota bacterium]PYO68911.1 MAG: LPS export ABC transporter periplasmic protein LptC [Gemmatimonadota bacterium]PYO83145.1 MAG: LPS export ABC transporter periplasmic protein LptC [Gemmatimonadota bacterium]PYP64712.1 MAG: LPS export ABC transporter periplasmic protein LptC [Gemmatimonadota bacterium]
MKQQQTSNGTVELRRPTRAYWSHVLVRRLCSTLLFDAVVFSACSGGVKPTATIQLADSADQTLIGMTHNVTQDGVQRARVRADTAYFFNAVQQAELRAVHVTFYDVMGRETSTMTAREGTFHWRTGDMEGRGNVVVVRNSDGGKLRTEVIRYNQARNQVSSDLDFTFDSPTQHLKGTGFTSDPDFKNIEAKHLTGTGGQFVLPKQ